MLHMASNPQKSVDMRNIHCIKTQSELPKVLPIAIQVTGGPEVGVVIPPRP